MSVAFTTDPKKVFHLSPPETGKASELSERGKFAENLALEVEKEWEELPPELRDALTRFAYSVSERDPHTVSRFRRFRRLVQFQCSFWRRRVKKEPSGGCIRRAHNGERATRTRSPLRSVTPTWPSIVSIASSVSGSTSSPSHSA